MIKKGILAVFIGAVITALCLYQQKSNYNYEYFAVGQDLEHHNGLKFAGSNACISCHEDIYKLHITSGHYLTSTTATNNTIKGVSEASNSKLKIGKHHSFTINEKQDGFYQTLKNDSLNTIEKEHKIDMVIGSGVKGQSYFSWQEDKLFQLQTSYFVPTKQWINSPGYKEHVIAKPRPISVSCLECHATFAKSAEENKTKYELSKRSIILGVDCERCHGPAKKHVEYQHKFPNDTIGKHIVKQSQLSRQQKMDMCALCHSGSKTKAPNKEFHFVLGDTLDNYLVKDFRDYYRAKYKSTLDVHGNQVELLEASKCFKKTETMDCNTCHSPHANERGNLKMFNAKCISCHSHKNNDCGLTENTDAHNMNNCIDCHMPLSKSNSLKIQNENGLVQVKVRSHFIQIDKTSKNKIDQYVDSL